MAAEIKVHRPHQIGGCVTEIWTENTRILIDFGEELPGSKNDTRLDLDWGPSADGSKPAVSAVFFTHYHGDHIGRFPEAYQYAHLYMSELSRDVLVNIHKYLKENLPWLARRKEQEGGREEAALLLEEAGKHKEALDILEELGVPQDRKRVHTFRPHEKKAIELGNGEIRVTPFWVDHSAGDACMFLIETADKTILHTGDFRGHGIQGQGGKAIYEEVCRLAAEKQIDLLITEGTMMSRQGEAPYSEQQLLETATEFFRDHRYVFLIVSSTNLDSISTFYQAAKANQISMYCHNPYVEGQVKTLGAYACRHWGMPDMEDVEQIRPWSAAQQEKMRKEGFAAIIKANQTSEELIQRFRDCNPVIIYSMWQGYVWRNLDPALCGFLERCHENGIPVIPPNTLDKKAGAVPRMHTSGHASPELIAAVIRGANPKELYPIHTEDAWEFLRLDIPETLKEQLQDSMIKAGEAGGYVPEEDHRSLSDSALKKFLPRGTHCAFIELVQKYPSELAFCFRGNSGNAAIIYYKNHVAFHITARGYVKFNFDHARFMAPAAWSEQRKKLMNFGYSFEKKQETQPRDGSESIGYVTMPPERAGKLTLEELEELYTGSIRKMIESFFREKGLREKIVQQQLFLDPGCKKLKHGYFFYDMEFSQPYGKLLGCKNQSDMLAIRFDANGKPERLTFVEVKSTQEALEGASGLEAHIQGMEQYPNWLLPIRGRDACQILNQYAELGLADERLKNFNEADFAELPKEILLIFTGQDTLAAFTEWKRRNGKRLNGYTMVPDMFSRRSAVGPVEVYHRDY